MFCAASKADEEYSRQLRGAKEKADAMYRFLKVQTGFINPVALPGQVPPLLMNPDSFRNLATEFGKDLFITRSIDALVSVFVTEVNGVRVYNWDKIEAVLGQDAKNISKIEYDAVARVFTLMDNEYELTRLVRLLGVPAEAYWRGTFDGIYDGFTYGLDIEKLEGLIFALGRMYQIEYDRFSASERNRNSEAIDEHRRSIAAGLTSPDAPYPSTAPVGIWEPKIPIVDRLTVLTILAEMQSSGTQFRGEGGSPEITIAPGVNDSGQGGLHLSFITIVPPRTPCPTGDGRDEYHTSSHRIQHGGYFIHNAAFGEDIRDIVGGNVSAYVRVDMPRVIFDSLVGSVATGPVPDFITGPAALVGDISGAFQRQDEGNAFVAAFEQGMTAVNDRDIASIAVPIGSPEQRIFIFPTHYSAGG